VGKDAKKDGQQGIACGKCGCKWLRVLYTRKVYGGFIRRRRECRFCGFRFSTHEKPLGE